MSVNGSKHYSFFVTNAKFKQASNEIFKQQSLVAQLVLAFTSPHN